MADRITDKHLDALCARINKMTGSPEAPYRRDADGMRANVGNYHVSHAYGGVCLHRMSNESGGVTTPLTYGHVQKRDLYNAMQAFIAGFEAHANDNTPMIRARLVREVSPGVVQSMRYIGPLTSMPAGWIICSRQPANRSN